MAKQPESILQRRIRRALEKAVGGKWRKIHGSMFQAAGILDLVGCVDGFYFEIEVKTPKGRPSALQLETIKDISEEGGCTGIVTSVEEAIKLVRDHLKKNRFHTKSTVAAPPEKSRRVLRKNKNRRSVLQTTSRKNLDSIRRNRKA